MSRFVQCSPSLSSKGRRLDCIEMARYSFGNEGILEEPRILYIGGGLMLQLKMSKRLIKTLIEEATFSCYFHGYVGLHANERYLTQPEDYEQTNKGHFPTAIR